jgi:RNA polymerase sigma factor (TIGR02999 family)
MSSDAVDITGLLRRWGEGDERALDELIPLVYERLRQLAHHHLRNEQDPSLNTTALVHEAYLKLVDSHESTPSDRTHFLSLASRVMRHLLVDHARARKAAKRGAGVSPVSLEEALWISDSDLDAYAELDEALTRLESMEPRQSQILEQRYFGGLSLEETAAALDISLATVKRELRSARAWLAAEIGEDFS